MWGPPMAVSYKAYGGGQALSQHPDLDDRDIQTYLLDRMMETRQDGLAAHHCRPTSSQSGYSRGRSASLASEDQQQGLYVFAPAHEGWLIKRGSHGLKLWRRRWVVMANQTLWYYAGPPARKEDAGPDRGLASIKLTAMTRIVDDVDELTFQVVPEQEAPAEEGEEGGGGDSPSAPDRSKGGSTSNNSNSSTSNHSTNGNSSPGCKGWHFRAESMPEKLVWLRSLRRCIDLVAWWGRLRIGRVLGQGGFSMVQEMEDMKTGERLAVKRIEARTRLERDQAVAEADILCEVTKELSDVPHLMGARRIYVDGNVLWVMFTLCKGGDLYQRVVQRKKMTEMEAAILMGRLLEGLDALHTRLKVVHLDIKPENLLFETAEQSDLNIKLGDFGFARKFTDDKGGGRSGGGGGSDDEGPHGEQQQEEEEEEEDLMSKHRTRRLYDERINGTIGYMAPEVVLHRRHGPPADVWACGVVLHILLVGYAPFTGKTERETLDRSVRGDYSMDPLDWARTSQDAKDLVRRMLTVDDALRITVDEVLAHPWIQRYYHATSIASKKASLLEPGFELESPQDANSSRQHQRPLLRSLLSDGWTAVLKSPIVRNSVIARLASRNSSPNTSPQPPPPPPPQTSPQPPPPSPQQQPPPPPPPPAQPLVMS